MLKTRLSLHPLAVRISHWLTAAAMFMMITSGWAIYNASPLFGFRFPAWMTLGGWLAGALLWHFAAMWLLFASFAIYLIYGFATGHFRRKLLPIAPSALLHDLRGALRGHLAHDDISRYNTVQRASYVGVLVAILAAILSGLAMWKPVQLQSLAFLMGGYEGARLVHFLAMAAIVAFIVVHLTLVVLVPRTFLPMIRGWARAPSPQSIEPEGQP